MEVSDNYYDCYLRSSYFESGVIDPISFYVGFTETCPVTGILFNWEASNCWDGDSDKFFEEITDTFWLLFYVGLGLET